MYSRTICIIHMYILHMHYMYRNPGVIHMLKRHVIMQLFYTSNTLKHHTIITHMSQLAMYPWGLYGHVTWPKFSGLSTHPFFLGYHRDGCIIDTNELHAHAFFSGMHIFLIKLYKTSISINRTHRNTLHQVISMYYHSITCICFIIVIEFLK